MKLIAEFELSALLVTRSEQGMTLLQPGRPPLHMPTQARKCTMSPAPATR
jgi:D-beta-D-heptose 7-phosphate kinase/D-beta-D-heptose 1-phosphate adenosyltransferase